MEDKGEHMDGVKHIGGFSWPFPQRPENDPSKSDWDYIVDSDGEKYEVYSDGTHEMTNKEWAEYSRQVRESDGYDVEVFDAEAYGIILPLALTEKNIPEFEHLASLALDKYNKDNGTRLQVKEIKAANSQLIQATTYYLTFDVVDPDAEDPTKVQVFQGKILQFFKEDEYEIEQIRPKPSV